MRRSKEETAFTPIEGEVWVDVPNTEGKNQISNLGRLRGFSKRGVITMHVASAYNDHRARYNIKTAPSNRRTAIPLLELSYELFVGQIPDGHVVVPKDGDVFNFKPENIQVTNKVKRKYYARSIAVGFEPIKEEIWRDVPETVGPLQVSNLGRARSVRGKGKFVMKTFVKTINSFLPRIRCRMIGKEKYTSVSLNTWVYALFVGEVPEGFAVRHKDGDIANNNASNLFLVKKKTGYKIDADGEFVQPKERVSKKKMERLQKQNRTLSEQKKIDFILDSTAQEIKDKVYHLFDDSFSESYIDDKLYLKPGMARMILEERNYNEQAVIDRMPLIRSRSQKTSHQSRTVLGGKTERSAIYNLSQLRGK